MKEGEEGSFAGSASSVQIPIASPNARESAFFRFVVSRRSTTRAPLLFLEKTVAKNSCLAFVGIDRRSEYRKHQLVDHRRQPVNGRPPVTSRVGEWGTPAQHARRRGELF